MSSTLKAVVAEYLEAEGLGDGVFETPVPGLSIMRSSKQLMPHFMVYKPALCVVAQGAKQIMLGEQTFDYDAGMALVVSVQIPAVGRVTQATAREPYIGITLDFDVALMREVAATLDEPPVANGEALGVFVDRLCDPSIDCMVRLIRLLSTPQAIPVLYPVIMKEICYWLLTGPNGEEVCKIATPTSHTQRIANAIHVLRENFSRTIRMEELAAVAGMSASSFHQHFKMLTAMTPLQYQKQLRLLEARRLMATDAVNATHAAFQVGYESASQFSREYARMFGMPPKRDSMSARLAPLAY